MVRIVLLLPQSATSEVLVSPMKMKHKNVRCVEGSKEENDILNEDHRALHQCLEMNDNGLTDWSTLREESLWFHKSKSLYVGRLGEGEASS